MPDIIVLIPHYNDIEGLNKSLNSVSDQEAVDVLIIDDGSIVKPDQNKLKGKFNNINDIIVLLSSPNKGQPHVENIGLKYIIDSGKYKYIARLDSGDTSYPERFKIQKQFFEQNPDISIIGTHAMVVDLKGEKLFFSKMPLTHKIIKKNIHVHNCFLHSTIMFRVEALNKVGFYSMDYFANDDYDFWFRFIKKTLTANIDKCLGNIELNSNSLSRSKYRKVLRAGIRILLKHFSFKYFFYSIRGLLRAFACYIIGVKLAMKISILLNKNKQ